MTLKLYESSHKKHPYIKLCTKYKFHLASSILPPVPTVPTATHLCSNSKQITPVQPKCLLFHNFHLKFCLKTSSINNKISIFFAYSARCVFRDGNIWLWLGWLIFCCSMLAKPLSDKDVISRNECSNMVFGKCGSRIQNSKQQIYHWKAKLYSFTLELCI